MSIINYNAPCQLLAIARGHPYEREAFADLLGGLDEFDVCHVEQPAAQRSTLTITTTRAAPATAPTRPLW